MLTCYKMLCTWESYTQPTSKPPPKAHMMIAFLIPDKYKDRSLFDAIRNDAFLHT